MKRVHIMDEFGGTYIEAVFEEVGIDVLLLLNMYIDYYDPSSLEEKDALFEAIATAVDNGCETEEELTEVINSLVPKDDDQDELGLECLYNGFTVIVRPIK